MRVRSQVRIQVGITEPQVVRNYPPVEKFISTGHQTHRRFAKPPVKRGYEPPV